MRRAFSMIELVFVIVVLGIIATIAIPKFAATRTDAKVASARATVSAVRSGIVSERQTRLLRGDSSYIADLGSGFSAVLSYPAKDWTKNGDTYSVAIDSTTCSFDYNSTTGLFLPTTTAGVCSDLDF